MITGDIKSRIDQIWNTFWRWWEHSDSGVHWWKGLVLGNPVILK